MMVPSEVIVTLSIWPAAEPFWSIDEFDDGDVKPLSDGVALASIRSQVMALTVAPLVHVVGPGSVTSAAGAVITPRPLKVTVPTGPSRTVPAVVPAVPVASVPGTVTS